MSVIHAIILGILQGITEFLPVSSFGHLCAVQHLMGGTRGSGVLFEVMLHIGTMAALILFLWKDIRKIGIELIGMILDLIGNANIFLYNRRTGKNLTYARIVTGTYRKLTALLVVSTIPTMLIGYQCKRLVVRTAASHMFSGIGLLLTGVILLVVDYSSINGNKGTREANYGDAMWMGICQGVSVFPGISRLGLTMSAGLFCGMSRKFAVKYSLLMSIPAVIGAFIVEMGEFTSVSMTVGRGFTYVLGMLIAGVTGYLVIRFMVNFVNQIKLRYFAFYCFAAGIIALAVNYI
ncbi:undecaprenyl-diphosphate phosphatase [Ruminococcus sp. AF46-10NS]|jgi:undecaprenyl-diphosphatase|uniref:undecaprenyl-diphosphate phosphatase n=1 Tax=Blautia luti TaxID=89014 RepID=UPI000E5C77B7|nr:MULTISPECIES: undecaprenyl-diphosphate phosphatase [Clostridia]MCB5473818.1 undecaprenyl-diphosphate phosphatase [Blautia luti]RHK26106.1 undecaprenyl-diphosphate phosphatase [Ruminococcus sp. AF46-10NS]